MVSFNCIIIIHKIPTPSLLISITDFQHRYYFVKFKGKQSSGRSVLGWPEGKSNEAMGHLTPIHEALLLTLKLRPTGLEIVVCPRAHHLNETKEKHFPGTFKTF